MRIKQLKTKSYHPHTNGQTERYIKTIFYRLRNYVAENQSDSVECLQPLTYSYNIVVHRSTKISPFSLLLSRNSPYLSSITLTTGQTSDASNDLTEPQLKMRLLRELYDIQKKITYIFQNAQRHYKAEFYKKVRVELSLKIGELVFIEITQHGK